MTTTASLTLYSDALSEHSHRVRLALSLLNLPYELIDVDRMNGVHKTPEFLRRNPFGQVPVLDDGGLSVSGSNAILIHLAHRYDPSGHWLPLDPEGQAAVQDWLSLADSHVGYGPAAARRVTVFGAWLDAQEALARSHQLLQVMDDVLAQRPFLAKDALTLADIAGYSRIVAAPEGRQDLAAYPQVRAWLARIEALPGFVTFQEPAIVFTSVPDLAAMRTDPVMELAG